MTTIYRNLIFLFSTCIFFSSAHCQFTIEWEKSYGGTLNDFANSIYPTSDGGYILAGSSYSNNAWVSGHHGADTEDDFLIIKLDGNGSFEWSKSFGGNARESATVVKQTGDGGYIVGGSSNSSDGDVSGHIGAADYWIVKLDPNGIIQWERSYGGSGDDRAYGIVELSGGGYMIAGTSMSDDVNVSTHHGIGWDDIWLVKIDASGNLIWEKTYGGTLRDWIGSIISTSDGGYVFTGRTFSQDGDIGSPLSGGCDLWIVKTDVGGNIEWEKTYGGSLEDYATSVIQTNDGGYAVLGTTNSNDSWVYPSGNYAGKNYWLIKTNSSGIIEWKETYGGDWDDYSSNVIQTANGGFLLGGDQNLIQTDLYGNLEWQLGPFYNLYGGSITETLDGGVAMLWSANDSMSWGLNDFHITKLQSVAGVNELENDNRLSIFPNPFENKLSIESNMDFTHIEIYNLQGQKIFSCPKQSYYELGNIGSGIYSVKLLGETGEVTGVQKIVKF